MYQIRKELHLSRWELAWGESWINISMMLADAPRYVTGTAGSKAGEISDDDLKTLANKLN